MLLVNAETRRSGSVLALIWKCYFLLWISDIWKSNNRLTPAFLLNIWCSLQSAAPAEDSEHLSETQCGRLCDSIFYTFLISRVDYSLSGIRFGNVCHILVLTLYWIWYSWIYFIDNLPDMPVPIANKLSLLTCTCHTLLNTSSWVGLITIKYISFIYFF